MTPFDKAFSFTRVSTKEALSALQTAVNRYTSLENSNRPVMDWGLGDCSVPGCPLPVRARGVCSGHYRRITKGQDLNTPLRVWNVSKPCAICGEPKGKRGGWGLCNYHYNLVRKVAFKLALIEAFGGACQMCDGIFHHKVYEFHHVDESSKDFGITKGFFARSQEHIAEEVSKCVMLCANCHRTLHALGEEDTNEHWEAISGYIQ